MPFLLHNSLKAEQWSKHKSFLTGSTGVGDKLKTLETFAKCKEDDADGLTNLIGAIAALTQTAVPAYEKAKASKIVPSGTSNYLKEMIAKAAELRALVVQKQNELKAAPKAAPKPPATPPTNTPNATAPNSELIKKVAEKINTYKNDILKINENIESKHLSGKEITDFKEWSKTSQSDLKQIFESAKINKIAANDADSKISKVFENLKNYQNEINELKDTTIKPIAANNDTIKKLAEKITAYQSDVQKLNGDIDAKKLTGAEITNFKTWSKTSQTNLKQIFESAKINKIAPGEIDAKVAKVFEDLKNYQNEIKEISNTTNAANPINTTKPLNTIKATPITNAQSNKIASTIIKTQENIIKNRTEISTLRKSLSSSKIIDKNSLNTLIKDLDSYKNDVTKFNNEIKDIANTDLAENLKTYKNEINTIEKEINTFKAKI